MAILSECAKCGASFGHAASDGSFLCSKCDGTEEMERKEEERWRSLSVEDKLEELRKAIKSLQHVSSLSSMIG